MLDKAFVACTLQLEEKRKKAKSEGRSSIEEDDPDKVGVTVCASDSKGTSEQNTSLKSSAGHFRPDGLCQLQVKTDKDLQVEVSCALFQTYATSSAQKLPC